MDALDNASASLETVASGSAAQMTAENFPVALRLLPRTVRADLATVYRYARFVDDVGDEAPGGPEQRLALLDVLEAQVRALPDRATLGPVRDLAPLVRSGRVPPQPFLDLIEANRVDQVTTGYETFDDLLGYCRLSAAPVGRVVLHLAGAARPDTLQGSDAVCAALQVLEHCQDVGEDARMGRVYLPAEDLRSAGIEVGTLTRSTTPSGLRRVTAQQVARARALLADGPGLVRALNGWARFAVAGFVAGGLATADALEAADFDVLADTVRPSRARTARHAVALLARRR